MSRGIKWQAALGGSSAVPRRTAFQMRSLDAPARPPFRRMRRLPHRDCLRRRAACAI